MPRSTSTASGARSSVRARIGGALLLGAAVAACGAAAGPEAPAPVDPTGFYDFVASRGGDERTGTLEIERTPAGLDAEAWLTGEPQPALADSVVVDGSSVVLYTLVGGGDEVVFHLDFTGASFDGFIVAALDTIDVRGTRRAQ